MAFVLNGKSLLLAGLGLALISTACLLYQKTDSENKTSKTQYTPTTNPGLKVYKDPVTGEFTRPTPEQMSDQAKASKNRIIQKPVQAKRLPDGTLMLELQDPYRPDGGD